MLNEPDKFNEEEEMHPMNQYIRDHIDIEKYPELEDYVNDVVDANHCYERHYEWFQSHDDVFTNPELKEYLMELLDTATIETHQRVIYLWGRFMFKERLDDKEDSLFMFKKTLYDKDDDEEDEEGIVLNNTREEEE